MANIGYSDAQALAILTASRNKAFDSAARAEVGATAGTLAAKARQLTDASAQAKGEQADSILKFASSTAGLGVNFRASVKGSSPTDIRKMKDEADAKYQARLARDTAKRTGMNTAAQSGMFSQLIDKATDAFSQNLGPQAQVQAAKVDQKLAELDEAVASTRKDGAKTNKDAAAKALDGTLDLAKELYQRHQQVIDRAFGG